MLDFLSSDIFIICLEIVFLLLIAYDIKQYVKTKRKDYLVNIVMTIGFFIWASIPFYNSYFTWDDSNKESLHVECLKENNETTCSCINSEVFKEYNFSKFKEIETKTDKDYIEFTKEAKEDCLDDSWF